MLRRPLVFIIIAFIMGIILVEIKRTILLCMVLLFFLVLLINYIKFRNVKNYNNKLLYEITKIEKEKYLLLLLSMCIACVIGVLYTTIYLKIHMKEEVENIEIVQGVIKECNIKNGYVENIVDNIKINNKKTYGKIILKSKNEYQVGDLIKSEVNVTLPQEERNEGGFNYRKYLYSKKIYLICEEIKGEVISKNNLNIIVKFSLNIKKSLQEKIKQNYPEAEGKILSAVLLGEKDEIDENYSLMYERAGMIHLLVVSGAHIAFLIALFMKILKFLYISKRKSNVVLLAIIIVYMIITGLSESVLRAGIVSIILIISKLLKRQNDTITTMFIAMFILLLNNPLVIYSVGFLLSFSGALSIVLLNKPIYEKLYFLPEFLRSALSVTLAAQIFTTPIIIYLFNTLYLSGIFSNLLAVPLTTAILTLGIFSCIPVIGKFVAYANYVLIIIMIKIAEYFSSIEFLTYKVATNGLFWILVFYFYALTIFKIIKIKKKYLITISVSLILIVIINLLLPSKLEINFLDVGHGDSIFIVTPNKKTILIDTGDKYISNNKEYDTGELTIVPYILKQGFNKIDLLILTHMDSDHTGGAKSVLENIKVKNVAVGINSTEHESYKELEKILLEKDINIIYLKSGINFNINNVKFDVLTPTKELKTTENNNSITLKMTYKDKKVLFMGDLEIEGEEWLLRQGFDLKVDIIKIGHHGSQTSTSEEFINKVKPQKAIISVGNRFESLPNEDVIKRLNDMNVEILRTDEIGEIKIEI